MPGLVLQSDVLAVNTVEFSVRSQLIVIMVGLPARGKSYISQKLARYLNWLQLETRVFNAGQTRRLRPAQKIDDKRHQNDRNDHSANFFDAGDPVSVAKRNSIALETLDELLSWLSEGSHSVGILDATNSTVERRRLLLEHLQAWSHGNREILFLESCCYNKTLLEQNFQLKLSGPDYKHQQAEIAIADFQQRVRLYEKSYETIGSEEAEQDLPYLKLVDVGRQVIANNINGYLSSQVVEYLLNFRLHQRKIWITRNGESCDDTGGKIGRSSPLSQRGKRYAASFTRFMERERDQSATSQQAVGAAEESQITCVHRNTEIDGSSRSKFTIWTSAMQQAIETSQDFLAAGYDVKHIRTLNDVHAGKMEGMTLTDIASTHHQEMVARSEDPLNYRWPGSGGESYADVIRRLRPAIMELERTSENIILITHRAVVRIILAYFQKLEWSEITRINVPLGHVFVVEPSPYGVDIQIFRYNDDKDDFEHVPHSWVGDE